MQTFAKLALAAGACALGLGAVAPVQAADMGYPEAQAAPGYPAPPPGYYAPPPAQQGYYPPPPPPAAYGYPPPPPSNTAPTSRRLTSWRRDRITCRGRTGAATGRAMPMAMGTGAAIGAGEPLASRTVRRYYSSRHGRAWPVIHVLPDRETTAWMPGTSPAMTRDFEHLRIFAVRD